MMQALAASLLMFAAAAAEEEKAPPTAELYKTHCRSCHTADGDSPLALLNFADGEWKHGSAPEKVAAVIKDGVPGTAMLPFDAKLTPAEVRALAAYVRAFDKRLKPPAKGAPRKK
jgi:mono/diheme cytochrome c family protein